MDAAKGEFCNFEHHYAWQNVGVNLNIPNAVIKRTVPMIVLHKEKMIILKARKVSGTSFEIALSRYADKHSIITPISGSDEDTRIKLGWRGPQNYKCSLSQMKACGRREILNSVLKLERPKRFYNHIPANEAKQNLGEEIWNNYTKVSIVRNPFDYMVSFYFWATKSREQRQKISFQSFVLSHPELVLWNRKIYEIEGKNVIDFMIRYDHLHEDIAALEWTQPSLGGLANTFQGIHAKGNSRPREAKMGAMYMDAPRAYSLIYNVCLDEIERYDFKLPAVG